MKLKFSIIGWAALCAVVLAPAVPAHAQADSALLDALVKKGVISDQEAEDIRATDAKDYAMTAASKINLATSIKTITFYGDVRLRYELRDGTVHSGDIGNSGSAVSQVYTHNDSQTRSRWRYRLRFGFKGDLYDNFFYGVRAATGFQNDRSGNVTFGDTDNGGVFGNTKSLLGIDRVYLGWKPTDYLTLEGGKMENPFYTTNLVWSDDLSPTGAAEMFDQKVTDKLEIFATAGQFVYGDSADNTANLTGGANFDDIFLFGEQVGFKVNFDDTTSFKAAASMWTYSGETQGGAASVGSLYSSNPVNYSNTGASTTSGVITTTNNENNSPALYNGPFVGTGPAPSSNVSGINSLAVLETPMEFDFKAWNIPMRVFGDFAFNFEAGDRANAARHAINALPAAGGGNSGITGSATGAGAAAPAGVATSNFALINSTPVQGVLTSGKSFLDQSAFQFGFEAGQSKKKGDWDGKILYQSTGYYAVDPNLIDADIFNAATNMQGAVVSVTHNWTDGLASTVRYAYGTPVNDKMATPNFNQDLQIGTIHEYNLFQADLIWKF